MKPQSSLRRAIERSNRAVGDEEHGGLSVNLNGLHSIVDRFDGPGILHVCGGDSGHEGLANPVISHLLFFGWPLC